jgi:hypothetical protein
MLYTKNVRHPWTCSACSKSFVRGEILLACPDCKTKRPTTVDGRVAALQCIPRTYIPVAWPALHFDPTPSEHFAHVWVCECYIVVRDNTICGGCYRTPVYDPPSKWSLFETRKPHLMVPNEMANALLSRIKQSSPKMPLWRPMNYICECISDHIQAIGPIFCDYSLWGDYGTVDSYEAKSDSLLIRSILIGEEMSQMAKYSALSEQRMKQMEKRMEQMGKRILASMPPAAPQQGVRDKHEYVGNNEEEMLRIALAMSLEDSKSVPRGSRKGGGDAFVLPAQPYHCLSDKKQDLSRFFYRETVIRPDLPFWCENPECGWLVPRTAQVLHPGWNVSRMYCPLCKTERPGFWTCPFGHKNSVEPYDEQYSLASAESRPPYNQPPPEHECAHYECEFATRTITIHFENSADMDPDIERLHLDAQKRRRYERQLLEQKRWQERKSVSFAVETVTDGPDLWLWLQKAHMHNHAGDTNLLHLILDKGLRPTFSTDQGRILSFWPKLALWFHTNPYVTDLCILLQADTALPLEMLLMVVHYACGFSESRDEPIRKWVHTLWEVARTRAK